MQAEVVVMRKKGAEVLDVHTFDSRKAGAEYLLMQALQPTELVILCGATRGIPSKPEKVYKIIQRYHKSDEADFVAEAMHTGRIPLAVYEPATPQAIDLLVRASPYYQKAHGNFFTLAFHLVPDFPLWSFGMIDDNFVKLEPAKECKGKLAILLNKLHKRLSHGELEGWLHD